MDFQDQVNDLIARLLARVDKEVPEYGDFAPLLEFFDNLDEGTQKHVSRYGLKLYKMPQDIEPDPKNRYLEAAAYLPGGAYKADLIVGHGHKEDIVALLNNVGFPTKLNRTYGKLLYTVQDI